MGKSVKDSISFAIIVVGVASVGWLAWTYLRPAPLAEPDSPEALRAVLESGVSPEARIEAVVKLGEMGDERSMPLLFQAMEDPDPLVRGQAGAAVQKIMKADYYFRAEDPPDRRKAILAKIKEDWEAYLRFKPSQPAAPSENEGGR